MVDCDSLSTALPSSSLLTAASSRPAARPSKEASTTPTGNKASTAPTPSSSNLSSSSSMEVQLRTTAERRLGRPWEERLHMVLSSMEDSSSTQDKDSTVNLREGSTASSKGGTRVDLLLGTLFEPFCSESCSRERERAT